MSDEESGVEFNLLNGLTCLGISGFSAPVAQVSLYITEFKTFGHRHILIGYVFWWCSGEYENE